MKKPLILEIKGNSLDDGPGIRTVVFLKGCPLSCVWCHNPESKKKSVEISFESNNCVDCRTCIEVCREKALAKTNDCFIDRNLCNLCFDCIECCPSGALERVGNEMEIDDVIEQVLKDKPFYDTSGGGVTFSGGEPTLHMAFLGETARRLKEKGVHVLVETCGQFNYHQFIELVYPHIDLIYFDIKILNSDKHAKYCGLSNTGILENFKLLYKKYAEGGVEVLPRTPLIPGITDSKENLEQIISLYHRENVKKTELMAYHPLWQDKNLKIGISSQPSDIEQVEKWISSEKVNDCRKLFSAAGIALE